MDDLSRMVSTVNSLIDSEAVVASFIGLFIFIIMLTVADWGMPGL